MIETERMHRSEELANQIISGLVLVHGIEAEQEWTKIKTVSLKSKIVKTSDAK